MPGNERRFIITRPHIPLTTVRGRRDAAIADFRAALKLDPSDQSVQKGLRELGANP